MKDSVSTTETVDIMALDILTGSGPLRAVKVLSNGKRRFDPIEKDRLIDAAMKPGVSVARLALAHGVNANQLRNWVKLRRDRQAERGGSVCLNSFGRFAKWISASIMPPPSLVSAR